jgi:hypothetical protein
VASTRTISLPKFRPSSIPMNASGALSKPSTVSSLIANAAVCDAGSDLAQEFGVVLFGKFGIDESAQGQALRQDLAHCGRQSVRAVAGARPLYWAIRPQTGTRAHLLSNGRTACQIGPPTFSK